MGIRAWLGRKISDWLVAEKDSSGSPLCDYDRLSYEIRPADIILVEGRSRVSEVIKIITQSTWSHSALYVGRLHDIVDPDRRAHIERLYDGDPNDQLVIEAILGKGTIVTPLINYREDHLRICRPRGLSGKDAQHVIGYAIDSLGSDYDVKQLLDLARFVFPWAILPRRFRSSLFEHNAGIPTSTVCSTMMASAFMAVKFPILPIIQQNEDGTVSLYQRNPRHFTPRDFDYSPYFDIIKYPYIDLDNNTIYQNLPWNEEGMVCNDEDDCFIPGEVSSNQQPEATPDTAVVAAAETPTQIKYKGNVYPLININLKDPKIKEG